MSVTRQRARVTSHLTTMVAAALVALGGAQAQAAVVEIWDVDATAVWVQGQTLPAGVFITDTLLQWGTDIGNGQSSLEITPSSAGQPTMGPVTTVGPGGVSLGDVGTILNTFDITHTNVPIQAPSLESTVILLGLTLTPNTPPLGGSFSPVNLNVPIVFDETTNNPPGGPIGSCAGGTNEPCADIFVIGQGAFDFPFMFLGESYFLSGFPLDGGMFSTLEPAQCASAGAASGCIGFITPESAATTAQFGIAIATQPQFDVPEPGILALVVAGLLLVGARRPIRSRKV